MEREQTFHFTKLPGNSLVNLTIPIIRVMGCVDGKKLSPRLCTVVENNLFKNFKENGVRI
jgi:hypothetical protein